MRATNFPYPALGIASLLLGAACFDQAWASNCADEIASFEKKLNDVGATSAKANSGGQAVAAERGAHAQSAENQSGDPAQNPETSSNASPRTDASGGAGDQFMAAKVAVNDARNADKKGDSFGCEAALSKAKDLAHR